MRNGKVATKAKPRSAQVDARSDRVQGRLQRRFSTAAETAFLILDEQFDKLSAEEKKIRDGGDPAAVHDMRVASRRIRACLRAFSVFLNPGLIALEKDIKWMFSTLGKVRDLDICIELMNAQPCEGALHTAEELAASLRDARSDAFNKLLAALDSSRYHDLVQNLRKELHKGPQASNALSGTAILAAGADIIAREFRQVRKAGEDLEPGCKPAGFHTLRKRAKRFRYTLEFVKPLYGKRCEKMISGLKDLQEILGDRQDQIMFAEHVESVGQKGRP